MRKMLSSRYVKLGFTIFFAGCALILFYLAASNFKGLGLIVSTISRVLSPFIYGFVMAYLLSPIYNAVVRKSYPQIRKVVKNKTKGLIASRILATLVSLATLIGIIGGLLSMVIPELLRSILSLAKMFPDKVNQLTIWLGHVFDSVKYPMLRNFLDSMIPKARDMATDWINNDLVDRVGGYLGEISQGVIGTVYTLVNILIGVIICVYILNGKERFKAQSRRIIIAGFNNKQSGEIFQFGNYVNRTFGGFINGKLIDSAIIGVLCFILMSIINLPYAMLISVVIGVTNFIPFFGPFIGAIPSVILIFIINPIDAVYFILMILGLQQFDGNILGPKILGGTTGLGSFWVMFAIIVGGGLFGFLGMILGVPVCAVIGYYLERRIRTKLGQKNMPTGIKEYEDYNNFDISRGDFE